MYHIKSHTISKPSMTCQKYAIISGYASVFNNIDRNKHIVLKNTLQNLEFSEIPLLWQHDTKNPLGRLLHIKVDDIGLYVEVFIQLKNDMGRVVYDLVNDEIVDGLSVGIQVEKSFFDSSINATIIQKAQLLEVSIASIPINPKCKILFHSVIANLF